MNITIRGRVQGVGFRFFAKSAANKTGITGYIRNKEDGSVYMEAEGPAEALEQFMSWCYKGPPTAKIEHVKVTDGHVRGFTEFDSWG